VIGTECRDCLPVQRKRNLKGFEIAHGVPPGTLAFRFNRQRFFHRAAQWVLFAVLTLVRSFTQRQMFRINRPAPGCLLGLQTASLDHVQHLPFRLAQAYGCLFECELHDNFAMTLTNLVVS
jgi:hypothetical protein